MDTLKSDFRKSLQLRQARLHGDSALQQNAEIAAKETQIHRGSATRVIRLDPGIQYRISTSSRIKDQLMVCSHERSGTHFMMNTIGAISQYCSDPWLDYDVDPFGSAVNFYDPQSARSLITTLSMMPIGGEILCNTSILKSHHRLSHLGKDTSELPLKIIYIYRNPYDTLVSFWRYLHRWEWNEGPKTESPLALATTTPSGHSQRYQACNHKDYFERWAAHVIDGIEHCDRNPNACAIAYEQLLQDHSTTTMELCKKLQIEMESAPTMPSRQKSVISGKSINLAKEEARKLKLYCLERLSEYPRLKALFA